eukprot:2454189-Rhodomonas_salina.1
MLPHTPTAPAPLSSLKACCPPKLVISKKRMRWFVTSGGCLEDNCTFSRVVSVSKFGRRCRTRASDAVVSRGRHL